MSHPHYHAESSAKRFGGKPEDYIAVHNFFDETKEMFADFRHRALRHHSHGIFEAERRLGLTITNSEGKEIPVRMIAEQHIREDCGGRIPTVADWLQEIIPHSWMNRGHRYALEMEARERTE
jgi:hypothetical protein